MTSRFFSLTAAATAIVILSACGGGGGGGGGAGASSTTISGSVVKGPVNGATVTIKNAATGAVLGTTTTNAAGTYSIDIDFDGDVIVEANGGSYLDEATNAQATLNTPMRTVITAHGSAVTGVVTPLTTMAYSAAFGGSNATPSASAFNTAATNIATRFQLTGVNLATTVPVVSGSLNDYGRILAALSEYLRSNSVSLASITATSFNSTQWADFSAAFNAAYKTAVPNGNITFDFTDSGLNIGGTGSGGGAGSCGVNVKGTITAAGMAVPLDLNYCITGIAAGSCDTNNTSLSQAISGQGGTVGAANLTYNYSPTCATGPSVLTINLQ